MSFGNAGLAIPEIIKTKALSSQSFLNPRIRVTETIDMDETEQMPSRLEYYQETIK
jgi:hypothetical protein